MEVLFQLFLALLFGVLIGIEREIKRKGAGLQTFSLIALSSCLVGIISQEIGGPFSPYFISAVLVGVGFLGGGVIFQRESGVFGLTTAAAIWFCAILGLLVGLKFYFLATISTFLALLILVGFGEIEKRIF